MLRLRVRGRSRRALAVRGLAELSSWLGRLTSLEIAVRTAGGVLRFRCTNGLLARRACTLYTKEPGTIAWLDESLGPDDAFLDIGANAGTYALYAARKLGPAGHVSAVEPHLPSAVALMRNVTANGLDDRVTVLTCALAERRRPARFDYVSLRTGSSRHQLCAGDAVSGPRPASVGRPSELKLAESVDALVAAGAVRPPQVVKVDVDGIEPAILCGMRATLTRPDRPRTVQVECAPHNAAAIEAILGECGYALQARHATMAGRKRLAQGADIAGIVHNAVFVPA